MKITRLSAVVFAVSLSISLLHPVAAAAPAAKEKVVFQVSDADPAKWSLALNNVKNVQQEIGADKSEIEIVVYGPGIGMLKAGSPVAARVDEAKKAGVAIVACQNTMASMKLTEVDMLANTSYVPAGVIELMHKQKDGYAYIRP